MNAPTGLPPYRSPAEIRRNRNFDAARALHCRLHFELYAHPRFTQLYMAAPRNVLIGSVVALWAAHNPADRSTWPTLGLLKQKAAGFAMCSPRMVDDVVARLKSIEYIEEVPAAGDGRVKLLRPTELMLAHDRRYNLVMFAPLEVLFPESTDYRGGTSMDPAFHLAQRAIGFSLLQEAQQRVQDHRPLFRHFNRDAGYPIAVWVRSVEGDGPAPISISELAQLTGVSRTHVRSVLEDLEAEDYLRLSWRGPTRLVQPTAKLKGELDQFIADVLSAHDLFAQLVRVTSPRLEDA